MNFGDWPRRALTVITTLSAAAALAVMPQAVSAQDVTASVPVAAPVTVNEPAAPAVEPGAETAEPVAATSTYTPLGRDMIKGQPIDKGITFQKQYSRDGKYAQWMHDAILLPIITVICLFVLGLLLWVVVRFNRRANAVPSKTTHNTFIEVVWTLVPVLILVGIAVPSITLLARQYESPPKDAITIKAIGVQWNWEYEFPDHDVSLISKMLNEEGDPIVNNNVRNRGSQPWDGPEQLEVDNRLVVPVGVPLRIQTTANDVIHSFAVPSLWFKIDAVPGRLNERMLVIEEPGIYYGQCSELCGAKHGYMPIAIEALPRAQWEAWIIAQGGTLNKKADAAAAAAAADTAPAAATPAAATPAAAGAPAAAPTPEPAV